MPPSQTADKLPAEIQRTAIMDASDDQLLLDKLKTLSPALRAEVEDFIDFLKSREGVPSLVHVATRASEPAFSEVWDNPADAEYDRL
jgi:hypothetical protein